MANHFFAVAAGDRVDSRRVFDLITCVHGLHCVGDKLAAITPAEVLLPFAYLARATKRSTPIAGDRSRTAAR